MKRTVTNFEDSNKKHRNEEANTSRSVYLGGVPSHTSFEEILDNVKGGNVENVRRIAEKNCVFVDFMDHQGALAFYEMALAHKMVISGSEIKVGWGKPNDLPTNLMMAFQGGATRNVYLGGLDESTTVELLKNDFSRFGEIEKIKFIKEKKIAFIHFVSVADALNAVASISSEPAYSGKRINYGKDRCSQVEPSNSNLQNQQYQQQHYEYYMAYYQQALISQSPIQTDQQQSSMQQPSLQQSLQYQQQYEQYQQQCLQYQQNYCQPQHFQPGRTIYLGGLHPETSAEDLCNVIRGGLLHNIKVVPEKRCAFVTFVDPNSASAFFTFSHYQGIIIRGHRLKAGWGKSLPLPPQVALALQKGASRNVYIGNIPADLNLETLNKDFAAFGQIESINIVKAKNIAFVNFTNLLSAVKAVECIKNDTNSNYKGSRISFGKDRCASVDSKTLLAQLSEKYTQFTQAYDPSKIYEQMIHNPSMASSNLMAFDNTATQLSSVNYQEINKPQS